MSSSARQNSSDAAPANNENKKKLVKTAGKKTKAAATTGQSSKGPIRLSPETIRTAAQFAELSHRSVPNQIEYWSKLGQLLENALTATEVHQLLAGNQCLGKVEVRGHVNAGSIVDLVEKARTDGNIHEGLSFADYVYDMDSDNKLRRTDKKGNVVFGKLMANEFVEDQSSV